MFQFVGYYVYIFLYQFFIVLTTVSHFLLCLIFVFINKKIKCKNLKRLKYFKQKSLKHPVTVFKMKVCCMYDLLFMNIKV